MMVIWESVKVGVEKYPRHDRQPRIAIAIVAVWENWKKTRSSEVQKPQNAAEQMLELLSRLRLACPVVGVGTLNGEGIAGAEAGCSCRGKWPTWTDLDKPSTEPPTS